MSKSERNAAPGATGNAGGLGEAFKINLSTGQGTNNYQMPVPEGIANLSPKLTLEYAQGYGNSAFGLGWRLNLRSISLRLDFGTPSDSEGAHFMDSGAEIVALNDGSYRALRETSFNKYSREGDGWKVEETKGFTHLFGLQSSGRITPPDEPGRTQEWLLESTTDTSDNEITYQYRIDEGMAYYDSIRYAIYEIRFQYFIRPDIRHEGRAGFSRRRRLLCSKVELVLHPGQDSEKIIRSWIFSYEQTKISAVSLLKQIDLISHGSDSTGLEDVRRSPVTFSYSTFDPTSYTISLMGGDSSNPPPLTTPDLALITLDNAPLPGILINRNGKEYYWPNLGAGRWGAPNPLRKAPLTPSFKSSGLAFIDMDGSGTADLMISQKNSVQGYYENEGKSGWDTFVAFPRNMKVRPEWNNSNLRLTDADGDGLIDAVKTQKRGMVWWQNKGRQGWAEPVLIATTTDDFAEIDFSDPNIFLSDMTGDGLQDIVRVRSGLVEYWPNLGRGKFGEKVSMHNSPRFNKNRFITQLVTDLDGDGCAELLMLSNDKITIYPNQNGSGFGEPIIIQSIPTPFASTVRVVNMNGNARSGLMWNSLSSHGNSYVQFEFKSVQPPYLLERINNGTGLQLEIEYRSAIEDYNRDRNTGQSWKTNFPFPYIVVGKTKETDVISGRVTSVEFKYHEAHFEKESRQFQGFRQTERLEKGDVSRFDTLQVHHFLMAQEKEPGNGPEHSNLNGMLVQIETYSLDGSNLESKPYRRETSTHGLIVLDVLGDDRRRCFPFVTSHTTEDSERTEDQRIEEKTYQYDQFGNVTKETLRGTGKKQGVIQPERMRVTEIEYASSATGFPGGKPSKVCLRDSNGKLLTEKKLYYDGVAFEGLSLGRLTKGLVSREEEWVMTKDDFVIHYNEMTAPDLGLHEDINSDGIASIYANTKRTSYNPAGLVIKTKDPMGRETIFTYDSANLFRTGIADILGESGFEYDPANAQITKVNYPDGSITRYKYDAQGRLLHSILPGQNENDPSTIYSYDETTVPSKRIAQFKQPNNLTSSAITYYDGIGNEYQQRIEVARGNILVSGLNIYNGWGDVMEEFEPSFANSLEFSIPPITGAKSRKFFYDGMGRCVKSINFNDGVSTIDIAPFAVETFNANDNDTSTENKDRGQFNTPHREEFDVLRYLIRVVEKVSPSKEVATEYVTGPMGEVLKISDEVSVKMEYSYDRRGSRIKIVLRECGERKIWYDARKKPIQTLDGAGNIIKATFDDSGRLKKLMHEETVLEEYVYDLLSHNAFSRLANISYTGGSQEFNYSPAGQLMERTYHYTGEANSHSIRYEYDALGREAANIHSDGTRVEYQLTFNGWMNSIAGVVKNIQYNSRGLPTEILYENNVKTVYEYTPGPGRISKQTTVAANNVVLEDIDYIFDKMEVLLSSNDNAVGGPGLKSYHYDPLSQLTAITSIENGNSVERQYNYINNYNLARFDEGHSTLRYDDPMFPDRLSGIKTENEALFNVNYDGNGNTLNLPGQNFKYNIKNELTSYEKGTLKATYAYDHQGLRISREISDTERLEKIFYVGDKTQIKNGVVTCFVRFRGSRIAAITGGVVSYLHENPAGNTTFITNALGEKTGNIDYLPFGTPGVRSGDLSFLTFSLSPIDEESGLVYMFRRYYSPQLARFLTPDLLAIYQPEKFLHAPLGLHLYAFVANDPLNKADPTGMSFWSFVGAVVGVVVGIIAAVAILAAVIATGGTLGILLGIGLALGASLLVTGVAYIIASNVDPNSIGGQFLRGFMIGFNAGMNGVLAGAIFGPAIGIAIGVVNFLATFDGIAHNKVYQGILGWSSWIMPMSWGATAAGLVVYIVNLVMAGITFQQWDAAKIDKLGFDWKTGSFIMVGGVVRNGTAFNAANFVFVDPAAIKPGDPIWDYEAIVRHETGHTLNVAAFGTAFHIADFFGENVTGGGSNDYGERMAESHVGGSSRPTLPMWS